MAFNYLTIYVISDFSSLDAMVMVWLVKLPRMYLCLCAQESPRENPYRHDDEISNFSIVSIKRQFHNWEIDKQLYTHVATSYILELVSPNHSLE